MAVPLAWLQLTQEKRRFTAALAGIAFAVVLMLVQFALQDSLVASGGNLNEHLDGDLVLISGQYQNIVYTRQFTDRRLYQALGVDGVESVEGLYVAGVPFISPYDRVQRLIYAIAFDPRFPLLNAPGVAENLEKLRKPGVILYDSNSRPDFGPISEMFRKQGTLVTEIASRRVEIDGLFQLGATYGADGNIVMSDETFLNLLPYRKRGFIDVGVIRLKRGADPERTRLAIARILEPDVRLMSHKEFVDRERAYWAVYTAVGFIFKFGTLVGIFIGCIIVYQILYSDVTDHLPEYATLKAMGYPDRFLFGIVMKESLILSVLGFLPGLLISFVLIRLSRNATFLPIELTWPRVLIVYSLTAVMCTISGSLAMRRLNAADPADIF